MVSEFYFNKYQGTGNDFIMVDDREEKWPLKSTDPQTVSELRVLIERLCHRRFGIGADGMIFVRNHPDHDFEMVYFNSDGNPGSMCGNGGRCIVRFASELGVFENETTFMAYDGLHSAKIDGSEVRLQMQDVPNVEVSDDYFFMDTGSPHYISFRESVSELNVFEEGRKVRFSPAFREQGTNVNFAEVLENGSVAVRTYERGVENETLSCGTGVTACAIAATFKGLDAPVSIKTSGGLLRVSLEKTDSGFRNIFLSGPAEPVFSGTVQTDLFLGKGFYSEKETV